ncbi:VOC family protein [Candidatus Rariloculus sp.]|uniref:VOC family protein n=1 Tax=Candidatus Rariloculus sp. TaxID=3101265 RepID=UPI003D0F1020
MSGSNPFRILVFVLLSQASASQAQLSPPNDAGVAMGHLHYQVRDVEANKAFWIALGGEAAVSGDATVVAFPDVLVRIDPGETSGGTEGSVVNHVAFRVRSLADIEAAGFEVHHNEAFPGVSSVFTPEGERIELFDDELATNLGFSVDDGEIGAVADRHNRAITVPIIAHHIHLYVPEGDVIEARDWYAGHFGGVVGKRWRYDAVDLPGINLNFSGVPTPLAATEGRMLDHIGFEVENLEAFCASLQAQGLTLNQPYTELPSGIATASLTDPWGTYIELTEGLRASP